MRDGGNVHLTLYKLAGAVEALTEEMRSMQVGLSRQGGSGARRGRASDDEDDDEEEEEEEGWMRRTTARTRTMMSSIPTKFATAATTPTDCTN